MRISHSSISQVPSRHAMFKIGCYVLATLSSDVGSRNDVTPFTLTRQRTNRTHDQLRTLDSDVFRMHTNPRINASEVVSPTMSDAPVRVFWATVTRAYDRRSLDIMLNLAEVGSKDFYNFWRQDFRSLYICMRPRRQTTRRCSHQLSSIRNYVAHTRTHTRPNNRFLIIAENAQNPSFPLAIRIEARARCAYLTCAQPYHLTGIY
jgi:hypothetical protein